MTFGIESLEKRMTIAEYLDFEERSFEKHEYRNGKLTKMAGGTPYHSIIATNFIAAIKMALRLAGLSQSAFNSDAKIWLPAFNRYVYSDGGVLGVPPVFFPDKKGGVANPLLIAEVLSSGSTEAYDRGEKFELYKSVESFREYVLISQNLPLVEVFYRDSAESNWWQINTCTDLTGSVAIQSLGLQIQLADIYEGIQFEIADDEQPSEA